MSDPLANSPGDGVADDDSFRHDAVHNSHVGGIWERYLQGVGSLGLSRPTVSASGFTTTPI